MRATRATRASRCRSDLYAPERTNSAGVEFGDRASLDALLGGVMRSAAPLPRAEAKRRRATALAARREATASRACGRATPRRAMRRAPRSNAPPIFSSAIAMR